MISYLNDVKYSFNSYTMNRTTIAAGFASVPAMWNIPQGGEKKVMETKVVEGGAEKAGIFFRRFEIKEHLFSQRTKKRTSREKRFFRHS